MDGLLALRFGPPGEAILDRQKVMRTLIELGSVKDFGPRFARGAASVNCCVPLHQKSVAYHVANTAELNSILLTTDSVTPNWTPLAAATSSRASVSL
jgi:hypothetical protein